MGCSGASQHKKELRKISQPALPGCIPAVWGGRIPGFDVLDGVKGAPVRFLVPGTLRGHYLPCKHTDG